MTNMLDEVRAEMGRLRPADWLLWLAAIAPYAIGWLAGFVVRLFLLLAAAVIAGYRAGRGE